MSEHRGHGQHETEHIGDMVDRISNLPDCILHHILSFMPTKEVVKTSILATRWKNLWVSVPNLDFDDELPCGRGIDGRYWFEDSFMNFLERVLHSRSVSNLEKLRLRFIGNSYNKSEIYSCISSAIMHNVRELDLFLYARDPSVIPRFLFDSTSLVILRIRTYCVGELPSHVSFPCLKLLELGGVVLPNEGYIEKLLSGCPVLEEFVLKWCCLENVKSIMISSSTLKSLTMYERCEFNYRDGLKIEVDATNLTYFHFRGYRSDLIFLKNVPSLATACINISTVFMSKKKGLCQGVDLLKQLQHVVSLRLSVCIIESLTWEDNITFLVFQNLTHIMLSTEKATNHTFKAVMGLLSCCPVVQSICFSEEFNRSMQLGEKNSVWSSIPPCIKSCLKRVTLKNFHGYNSELCFLKCVLKHACALERIDVRWSRNFLRDLEKKTKVRKELGKTERRSTACVINFS